MGEQMQNGFYWYREVNGDLEVIEIDGNAIYRTGCDTPGRMACWEDSGQMDVLDGELLHRLPEPKKA